MYYSQISIHIFQLKAISYDRRLITASPRWITSKISICSLKYSFTFEIYCSYFILGEEK